MDFIEEKTPNGFLIKILLKKWQFLAFGKKGEAIYAEREQKSLLHTVPLIIFVGEHFSIKENHLQSYSLIKIRNGTMIIPYKDLRDNKIKYIFLITDSNLDLIPVRIATTKNVASMVKEIDATVHPDFVFVDESVTSNDVVIIKNRYQAKTIIFVEETRHYKLSEMTSPLEDEMELNINMMSQNPVFLTKIHLRSMNFSKINQILLDFNLTALDTEYILNFITAMLADQKTQMSPKNRQILEELLDSFQFYHYLLQKDDEKIKTMISTKVNRRNMLVQNIGIQGKINISRKRGTAPVYRI